MLLAGCTPKHIIKFHCEVLLIKCMFRSWYIYLVMLKWRKLVHWVHFNCIIDCELCPFDLVQPRQPFFML